MAVSIAYLLLFAGLAPAYQKILASAPTTGNIAYTLPTERTFLLNVPEVYDHDEPHPLVLSFHGAGGNSKKQQRITELSDPSLRIAGKPFLTAYAQGVNNTKWPMTHIWKGAPYENKTVDDIAYVFDIISTISSTYNVDRSRIYACGKSNGGGFTALLACRPDTSAIIAAFAPVSPALYQGTYAFHNCTPARPAPIFHIHGVVDTVTPFYGRTPKEGSFGPEPDVRLWRRQWADRNGCKGPYPGAWPEPTVTEAHPGAWDETWDCPGAEVKALSVEGLGHAWPSTLGLDLAGRPNQTSNFNLTNQHLVQFFSRHRL
ncbi:alpha/beta-hydrolase, partial [Thozetella sp. PMI_491]